MRLVARDLNYLALDVEDGYQTSHLAARMRGEVWMMGRCEGQDLVRDARMARMARRVSNVALTLEMPLIMHPTCHHLVLVCNLMRRVVIAARHSVRHLPMTRAARQLSCSAASHGPHAASRHLRPLNPLTTSELEPRLGHACCTEYTQT